MLCRVVLCCVMYICMCMCMLMCVCQVTPSVKSSQRSSKPFLTHTNLQNTHAVHVFTVLPVVRSHIVALAALT